ncbi:MAG: YkgJ family cysteine cluster protein [Nitrospirota bacterium]
MTGQKETNKTYLKPRKLSFPSDEKIHSWLPILIEAYYIVDEGIARAIEIERKKGRKIVCFKGCSSCCRIHTTIPVYPLELVGISWYVTEKISSPLRELLKNQLGNHKENGICPFIIDNACSIHPVRPISCRQFIVFDNVCKDGEDPYYTRREDVLTPIKKYIDKAFYIMLPFYGINSKSERLRIIESGSIHTIVKLVQTCNWKTLADKMKEFDKENR